jgi:hypothetical protein
MREWEWPEFPVGLASAMSLESSDDIQGMAADSRKNKAAARHR